LSSSGFASKCTILASVVGEPPLTGGVSGTAPIAITTLMVTPIVPIPEVRVQSRNASTPVLEAPFEYLQTYAAGTHPIEKGQTLLVNDVAYPITNVEVWPVANDVRVRLILQRIDD